MPRLRKKRQIALITVPSELLTEVFFDLNPDIETFIDLDEAEQYPQYPIYTYTCAPRSCNPRRICAPRRICIPRPCVPL